MSEIPKTPGKKDTVRSRKQAHKSSTQRFLPIAEIRNDTVVLKNGGLRAVIQVEALNFNLKSETEQKGIISGYESFVNTLSFPVQIVIRSTKMNIDPYISELQAIAEKQQNPLLKNQTISYTEFIRKIIDVADIMQKRFYLILPLDESAPKKSAFSQFFSWLHIDDSASKALLRYRRFSRANQTLRERVNLAESGLNNIGLSTKRLTTEDLLKLYYNIYNPKTSMQQKIADPEALQTEKMVL